MPLADLDRGKGRSRVPELLQALAFGRVENDI